MAGAVEFDVEGSPETSGSEAELMERKGGGFDAKLLERFGLDLLSDDYPVTVDGRFGLLETDLRILVLPELLLSC